MKQVAYVQIQVEKDENLYIFSMPMGAALADAAEVSFRMFKTIDQMYRDAIDKELKAQEIKSQETKAQEAKLEQVAPEQVTPEQVTPEQTMSEQTKTQGVKTQSVKTQSVKSVGNGT